ncbi:MAG: hypothetical protein HKN33_03860 [Pyrinomonadaceae bacterium]|nr:hypothetical protein [Pyrinomonadaceae bacterium]
MGDHLENLVNEINKELIDAYEHDKELFAELLSVQGQLGLLFGERPTCPFLRPHFLSRKLYDSIRKTAELIGSAAEVVTKAALEDDELMSRFWLTESEEKLVRFDPGYETVSVSSRLDAFVSGDEFKFLEFNAETPAGVGDQMQLEKVLARIPIISEFLKERSHWTPEPHRKLLQALFISYRQFGGTKSKPNIAIVDWEGVSTEPEFHILSDYFESNGFPTIILDPSEIEYDGNRAVAGSFEIDILYKRVLIHEFLEKFGEGHPLVEAYKDGNLCMVNSFRVKIPHKKALFAVLTGNRYSHLFSEEQLNAIHKSIPWTRRVEDVRTFYGKEEIELLEFIRSNRERFLLKPNDDYGGKGISLGWERDESDWEIALSAALKDPFVVQERAPITKQEFPVFEKDARLEKLLVDFDPFLFLNEVHGGMVRLSSDSLVNVTQGGGQTALVVLE